ncbi:MAG: hypothetical protein OXJ53_19305 [Gammaproteobacteria bacterium]|nr:hypothetical protein [Gammaproteobacteria bacterium]MDE0273821.1 hypothetical protein [Gammaproteobacteria bacterium]
MKCDLASEPRVSYMGTPSFYEPMKSAKAARWYNNRLRTPGSGRRDTVGEKVPAGFEAYVRIPHPKWEKVSEGTAGSIFYHGCWMRPVPYDAEVDAIVADEGQLIGPWAETLFEVLVEESPLPNAECVCGLWEGFGTRGRPATAHITIGVDLYLLYHAPLEVIGHWLSTHREASPSNVPSMAWPEDRRWCVVTPFQFFSTYVGGSRELIDRLLDRRDQIDVRAACLDDNMKTTLGYL